MEHSTEALELINTVGSNLDTTIEQTARAQ